MTASVANDAGKCSWFIIIFFALGGGFFFNALLAFMGMNSKFVFPSFFSLLLPSLHDAFTPPSCSFRRFHCCFTLGAHFGMILGFLSFVVAVAFLIDMDYFTDLVLGFSFFLTFCVCCSSSSLSIRHKAWRWSFFLREGLEGVVGGLSLHLHRLLHHSNPSFFHPTKLPFDSQEQGRWAS